MSCVYIIEQGAKVTVNEGKIVIDCKNNVHREIPIEVVESIMVFGNIDVTYSAQKLILEKGISMSFLSTRGRYFGRLYSTTNPSGERIKTGIFK